MKNELKQQAKDLYFQSGLTKTEIAERLGINRRTIMLWCQEGNWTRLRRSARHLPSLVAERCYYLLNDYTGKFLDGYNVSNFNEKHADAINKLATAIKKLKNRSTSNESMELLNYFIGSVRHKDPALAAQILPHVEDYIASRKSYNVEDNLIEEFDADGSLPFPTKEIDDKNQDLRDDKAFCEELEKAGGDYDIALENWQNKPSVFPEYDPSYFAPAPAPNPNAGYPLSRDNTKWTPSSSERAGERSSNDDDLTAPLLVPA
jgi:DNA-binding XRE family transcriptional regulator